MTLQTSLTGSFPIEGIYNPQHLLYHLSEVEQAELVRRGIERAISDQVKLGIDILVDGQIRSDIITMFCRHLPGFWGDRLPFHIREEIRPTDEPLTVADYLHAKSLAGERPLKAHLTGPMSLARTAVIEPGSGYAGKHDPKLILNLAEALGYEAKRLVEAGATIIQIDEPVLSLNSGLDIAIEGLRTVIEIGEIPTTLLHICGDASFVLEELLKRTPAQVLSIEGATVKSPELRHIDRKYLVKVNKRLALGCFSVANYQVEKPRTIQFFLEQMLLRLGEESIWGVTPNCGLRLMPYDIAQAKLSAMVNAARAIDSTQLRRFLKDEG